MTKLLGILAVLAMTAPASAFAAVTLQTVTATPSTVEEGQTITISVEALRSGSGCDNNWAYTKYLLDGPQIGTTTVGAFSGSGSTTDTFTFTASGVGSHTLRAELWSGEEDFNNGGASPDCSDVRMDKGTVQFIVVAAPSAPSQPSSGTTGGGGGYIYCDLHDGFLVGPQHMCLDRSTGKTIQTLAFRGTPVFAGVDNSEQLKIKLTQLRDLLKQIEFILKSH